jgi:type IV pilus assembly protein PilX
MKQLHFHRPPSQQQGVVLIFALIMLVLISMVSISMVRSTTMDERMAGGARDRNKAFQAAEYALRECLGPLQNNTYANTDPLPLDPTLPPNPPVWEVPTNWVSPISREIPVSYGTYPGLSGNPRCLFENLGSGSYRITARALGGADTTAVVLQATYSPE